MDEIMAETANNPNCKEATKKKSSQIDKVYKMTPVIHLWEKEVAGLFEGLRLAATQDKDKSESRIEAIRRTEEVTSTGNHGNHV